MNNHETVAWTVYIVELEPMKIAPDISEGRTSSIGS
jgi:hypothetical protein